MDYNDRIYGEIEIKEPVILELINSPTLQRLRGIDQSGYFEPYFPGTVYSRFEHSMGVFILLKKYNASTEEQIAGLIHDVSHSAFSHCIDYVLDIGSENDFDSEYILDDANFPLKEKDLPDLCADRIDYSLRTAVIFKEADNADINYFLNNLMVENDYWVFKNFENAKKYAELFQKLNNKYYAGIESAVMFRTVGDCLKYAIQKRYVSEDDLYTVDKMVLGKIKKFLSEDEKLKLLWDRMNNNVKAINNPNNYDAQVFCKSRVVDPLFKDNAVLKRISETEPVWNDIIREGLKPKEYFLKFEK